MFSILFFVLNLQTPLGTHYINYIYTLYTLCAHYIYIGSMSIWNNRIQTLDSYIWPVATELDMQLSRVVVILGTMGAK